MWLQDPDSRKALTSRLNESISYFLKSSLEDGFTTELASLLSQQREHHIFDLVTTEIVSALFQKALSIIYALPDGGKFDLGTERLRGEILAICDATGSALVDRMASEDVKTIFTTKNEALSLITKTALPTFDQNKHEK